METIESKCQYDRLSECGENFMSVLTTVIDCVHIEMADVLSRYVNWPSPTVIVSDGAYGLGLFPGDPISKNDLETWYTPHVEAWSKYALPETTLWFWCSEIGWATVHPLLEKHGWLYRSFHVWDKGIGHIAGNVNSKTIRRFPVVTEACVQYVRDVKLPTVEGKSLEIKEWLRYEWERSGLPLVKTNEACGVKNAATRKYFTKCHLWYFPPPDKMEQIVFYANKYGKPTDRPYFSVDGKTSVTAKEWAKMRSIWNHIHAVTNVWSEHQVSGGERIKLDGKTIHSNQKPLRLIEKIITASSDENNVVWEPFGGLCPSAITCLKTKRRSYSAEINPEYYQAAKSRLENFAKSNYLFSEKVDNIINLETSFTQSRILNDQVLQQNQQLSLFL
jgi:site-specific DNA-methyltransferase (adenine-specific)